MPDVVIVQEVLAAYRVDFYELLRTTLADRGVRLRLLYGQASGERATLGDEAVIEWAEPVRTTVLPVPTHPVWLSALTAARSADLVVVEHANRQLLNFMLQLDPRTRSRLALWGHGANLQSQRPTGMRERLKSRTALTAAWWFAYTDSAKCRISALGFPEARITTVQNAIDTLALSRQVGAVTEDRKAEIRAELGLTAGQTAIHLGSLHREKRVEYLLASAKTVAGLRPDFRLIVAGDGPYAGQVTLASAASPHLRYVGRVQGHSKAELLSVADVTLMPGLVGLGILDAFAAGAPPVAVSLSTHSPEFDYLESGVNGVCLPADTTSNGYAAAVASLLDNSPTLALLRRGCAEAALTYTNEAMVERFAAGVSAALARETSAS